MPHSLPSGDHLADFTAHFKRSTFLRDGQADVTFTLEADQLAALLDLQKNDGLALNITVHGTTVDDDDGLRELLGLLGEDGE